MGYIILNIYLKNVTSYIQMNYDHLIISAEMQR